MGKVLVLRTCYSDLKSYGGFQWPSSGLVMAPDWKNEKSCGHGLHGLLWGEGDGGLLNWEFDAKWLVVNVEESAIVDLVELVKFPRGRVVYCGDRLGATNYIAAHGGAGKAICGHAATAGGYGAAVAGYGGEALAGDHGRAVVGYGGKAAAGNLGSALAGDYGEALAGDYGEAIVGDYGEATAGDYGEAIVGVRGLASVGIGGRAIVGYGGSGKAGSGGVVCVYCWQKNRMRFKVGHVGKGGLKPNVAYRLDKNNEFVEA